MRGGVRLGIGGLLECGNDSAGSEFELMFVLAGSMLSGLFLMPGRRNFDVIGCLSMTMNKLTAGQSAAASPSLADEAKREKEICSAFQPIIAEHQTWATDPEVTNYPPGLVLRLVQVLLSVLAGGPFPQRLGAAWGRVLELAKRTVPVALNDLEAVDSSGKPKRAWMRAFEEFGESLKPKVVPNRVCPSFPAVMAEFEGDLRRDIYVARAFGVSLKDEATGEFRWKGPFFNASGDPDAALIFREMKHPGSVVPPGFHPEDLRNPPPAVELEPVPNGLLASLRRCLETNQVRQVEAVEDPATIEDLLCQGQYVPVIARIKNVSEEHVREVAARLGIAAKTQSDDYKPANILSAEDEVYQRNMQSPSVDSPASSLRPIRVEPESAAENSSVRAVSSQSDAERLNDVLRGLIESNPDVDTPRAMQALKAAGITASGAVVGRKLSEIRRGMVPAN